MPRIGNVNYHVHKDERQAFHIDAAGIVGNLVSPELSMTSVQVKDVRAGEATVSFGTDSVAFARVPTQVQSFNSDTDWEPLCNRELNDLLSRDLCAEEVVIFDHTVRIDDPNSDRKPARNVHSDYSPEGARQRLIDILGDAKAAEWSTGHYGFVNV